MLSPIIAIARAVSSISDIWYQYQVMSISNIWYQYQYLVSVSVSLVSHTIMYIPSISPMYIHLWLQYIPILPKASLPCGPIDIKIENGLSDIVTLVGQTDRQHEVSKSSWQYSTLE